MTPQPPNESAAGDVLASRVRGCAQALGAQSGSRLNFGLKMIEQRTAPYGTLLLRLTLGSLFIAHLYRKFAILPGGLEKWWSNFETSGFHWLVPWYGSRGLGRGAHDQDA
jgi:hypothetical protein